MKVEWLFAVILHRLPIYWIESSNGSIPFLDIVLHHEFACGLHKIVEVAQASFDPGVDPWLRRVFSVSVAARLAGSGHDGTALALDRTGVCSSMVGLVERIANRMAATGSLHAAVCCELC